MAHDEDFYELATRFPRAALALAGLATETEYRAESVEVKRARRVDLLFTPVDPDGGPCVYLEFQARHDPEVERVFLEELVMHCVKEGRFEGVRGVILYTERRFLEAAEPADIRDSGQPLVQFFPSRVVLSEGSGMGLEGLGGAAWAVRPLVGPRDEVEARAQEWHQLLVRDPTLDEGQRRVALELFCRLLADRLSTMDIDALLEDSKMEDTVTGQRLIARGMARGISRVLESRFGQLPESLTALLESVEDPVRLETLFPAALEVESLAAFEERLGG